jgi:AhpD family alkylhydroperoxidase
MAHIRLPEGIPGILGPMAFSPETAKPLNALAEVLLRGPSTLAPAEREMIATYVSSQNDCYFCQSAHGAVAAHYLGGDEKLVVLLFPTLLNATTTRGRGHGVWDEVRRTVCNQKKRDVHFNERPLTTYRFLRRRYKIYCRVTRRMRDWPGTAMYRLFGKPPALTGNTATP